MLIVTLMATYMRNIKPIGLDRLCGFTGTVFGPGFLVVRVGLHFVCGAIQKMPNNESLAPTPISYWKRLKIELFSFTIYNIGS